MPIYVCGGKGESSMNKHATLYLYELAWMLPSVALPVGMLAALAVTAFGAHIGLPGEAGRVDPAAVMQTAPFNQPGVVEIAPRRYEAHLVAGIWFSIRPRSGCLRARKSPSWRPARMSSMGSWCALPTSMPCCSPAR